MAARIGSDVLYRLTVDEVRPGRIVQVWAEQTADLVVFLNGPADVHYLEAARDAARKWLKDHPSEEPSETTGDRFTGEMTAASAPPTRDECHALIMRRGTVAEGDGIGEFRFV